MSLWRRLGRLERRRFAGSRGFACPAPADLEARRGRRERMKEALDDVARLRREGRDMDAGTREAEPEMRSLREALERRRNRETSYRGEGGR